MEQSSAKAFPKSGESIFPELSTKSQRVVWNPITPALPAVWPSFTKAYFRYLVTEGYTYRLSDREKRNYLSTPDRNNYRRKPPPALQFRSSRSEQTRPQITLEYDPRIVEIWVDALFHILDQANLISLPLHLLSLALQCATG